MLALTLFGCTASHKSNWILVTNFLYAAVVWSAILSVVNAAPRSFDINSAQQQQPQNIALQNLPLDLQPPIYVAQNNDDSLGDGTSSTAIDSYGNPIDTLKPIITPDGRKVVSAEGVQFEIPNYASGITELKKPAVDLLPPFIDLPTSQETDAVQPSTNSKTQFQNSLTANRQTGAYQPQAYAKKPLTTTTTTTTTTTRPVPAAADLTDAVNPFDSSTIPSWLKEFDYPDVGPGVPFVLDESNDVSNANLPSKIPIPLPPLTDTTENLTQPPQLFVPPSPATGDAASTDAAGGASLDTASATDNQAQTFAAPFDAVQPTVFASKPLATDNERFPPYNNGNGPISQQPQPQPAAAIPTNNPFLAKPSTNTIPTGFTTAQAETDNLITSSTINQSINLPTIGAGANNGLIKPTPFGVAFGNRNAQAQPQQTQTAQSPATRIWPDFGAPPGVLVPFDNTKSG